MIKVAIALELVASLGCSGCRKTGATVEDAPFETPPEPSLDPKLPRYARKPPRIDVPGTAKKGDVLPDGGAYPDSEILRPNNIVVTFEGARSAGRGRVAIAFTIANKGAAALPIAARRIPRRRSVTRTLAYQARSTAIPRSSRPASARHRLAACLRATSSMASEIARLASSR